MKQVIKLSMKKIDWLIILFILILSIFTLRDLLKPGYFTSHDGIHQVPRLYYFDQAIRDGQIPPRWAGGLLNGFGYPLFIFSYHMPWFIAEPVYLIGFSIFDSIKITFILGFLLSGISMFYFQKQLYGRYAALVGTILYLFAPFRFSNIFVRGAIGDATVFIFPPLIFLALLRIRETKKVSLFWICFGAVAFSGLILSHAMVAMLYFFFIMLYILYDFILIKKRKLFIVSCLLLFILTLGLTAYYAIPSFWEKKLTKFAEIMGPVHLGNTFISLNKLIYSPWGYGTMDAYEGAMSFQIGMAQWFAAFFALVMLLVLTSIKRRDVTYKEGIFFILVFILSVIMMLRISLPLWKIMSNIVVVDFPWRIMSVTVFSASVLAGFTISVIKNKKLKFVLASVFIFLAFYANRNHLRVNQTIDWPLDFYLKLEKTTNTYDEYTPKWVKGETTRTFPGKVETLIEKAKIDIEENKSNYLSFNINIPEEGEVKINTIYYPGWQVLVNNKPVEINYDDGLIEFKIQKGLSKVVARFTETPLRQVSNLLTLLSIGFIIFCFVKYKKV